MTTPKQIAKSLSGYAHHHDQLELSEIIIPQSPGSFSRSHVPRGIAESLLKTKKYALPIVILNPYFLAGIAASYLVNGRFAIANNAPIVPMMSQEQALFSGKIDAPDKALEADTQSIQSQDPRDGLDIQ